MPKTVRVYGTPTMSRILAPSNYGYADRALTVEYYWAPKPNPPTSRVTRNHVLVRSYRGPTTVSDHKMPTNYVRMIGKVTPGGSFRAYNNQYTIKGATALVTGLNLQPNGCNFGTGYVTAPTWMHDRAVMDAIAEMNQLSGNILEDLAQLPKTGQMIVDIVHTIVNLYITARKGLWWKLRRAFRQKGVNIPRHMANGWLMYFYGIKPLISTIDTLASRDKPIHKTMRVRKRISQNVSVRDYSTTPSTHLWVQFDGKATIDVQCQLFAGVKLDGNVREWQRLGLTASYLTNAVVTAWALAPYSFVVDWVIPVEAWLRTRSWGAFLEYQGGFVGYRHSWKSGVIDLWPWSGVWPYSGTLPTSHIEGKIYRRMTYPYTLPSSGLSIRPTLNLTQLTSAVALIVK